MATDRETGKVETYRAEIFRRMQEASSFTVRGKSHAGRMRAAILAAFGYRPGTEGYTYTAAMVRTLVDSRILAIIDDVGDEELTLAVCQPGFVRAYAELSPQDEPAAGSRELDMLVFPLSPVRYRLLRILQMVYDGLPTSGKASASTVLAETIEGPDAPTEHRSYAQWLRILESRGLIERERRGTVTVAFHMLPAGEAELVRLKRQASGGQLLLEAAGARLPNSVTSIPCF